MATQTSASRGYVLFSNSIKAHEHPKIVCRPADTVRGVLQTWKDRIIKDAGRGMVRNTGFYGQICLGQISSGTFGSYFSWYHS